MKMTSYYRYKLLTFIVSQHMKIYILPSILTTAIQTQIEYNADNYPVPLKVKYLHRDIILYILRKREGEGEREMLQKKISR